MFLHHRNRVEDAPLTHAATHFLVFVLRFLQNLINILRQYAAKLCMRQRGRRVDPNQALVARELNQQSVKFRIGLGVAEIEIRLEKLVCGCLCKKLFSYGMAQSHYVGTEYHTL